MTILKTITGLALVGSLAACDTTPGPSVPFAVGQNMEVARAAVEACSIYAPKAGKNRVRNTYIADLTLTPLIAGALGMEPISWAVGGVIGTALNKQIIYRLGEAAGVDRCLKDRGFARRDLTDAEMKAIDLADPTTRAKLLDHLVMGGQLSTFTGT